VAWLVVRIQRAVAMFRHERNSLFDN
jgi:hypothetical protein